MSFHADLHLHSRHAYATSRDADLEHMALWAARKGVAVLGTGDFTHPAWFAEIREKLTLAEPGLFRLKRRWQRWVDDQLPDSCRTATRFLLQVEVSTVYRQGDRARKVHHCLYAPDLATARKLSRRLARFGRLEADGRPTLKLDSRRLLEITLESHPDSFLIPAHIWTPWFAALGSKSGFDSIEECYGDLANHIFALETGLSSDPAMNARLSRLDRFTLVSSSDAHSPPKIGREACRFETEMNYPAIKRALETGKGFGGTVEFFPEEGKYHLDGHRGCGVCLSPAETEKLRGRCPVCGGRLTVGVLNRIHELADRPAGFQPRRAARFRSVVPLPEVLAEVEGVGPQSKRVQSGCEALLARIGPEFHVLTEAPLEEIERASSDTLAEALRRMRSNQVIRRGGFDGEYGSVKLFAEGELRRGRSRGSPI